MSGHNQRLERFFFTFAFGTDIITWIRIKREGGLKPSHHPLAHLLMSFLRYLNHSVEKQRFYCASNFNFNSETAGICLADIDETIKAKNKFVIRINEANKSSALLYLQALFHRCEVKGLQEILTLSLNSELQEKKNLVKSGVRLG